MMMMLVLVRIRLCGGNRLIVIIVRLFSLVIILAILLVVLLLIMIFVGYVLLFISFGGVSVGLRL